jgi:hypothetical protein
MAIDKITTAAITDGTITSSDLASGAIENQSAFKNIIINGDMNQAQRGTSFTSNGYTLDRFTMDESTDGAVTVTQDTDVPAGYGFGKSLKVDCTTADASIGAAQYCGFTQFIEGQNLQYLKYGTSSAESLTLSFWVRSTKTGTYCVRFVKEAGGETRYECPIEYTISSSDTWEKKTITLSPTAGSTSLITATAGAIVNSNASGFRVFWTLAAGTDWHGTNNTWTSTSDRLSTSNQVNFLDNTSNNFYITGVQLEAGTSASDFEFLPVDVNLQRCQRYYFQHTSGSGKTVGLACFYGVSSVDTVMYFPVEMRSTPSIVATSGTGYYTVYVAGNGRTIDGSLSVNRVNTQSSQVYAAPAADTMGRAGLWTTTNSSASIAFNSEL